MFLKEEERPVGEPEKVGTLKLSEAIRIGAKLRGQCFGAEWTDFRSCAMGAAMEAVGVRYGTFVPMGEAQARFPGVPRDVIYEAAAMNDQHKTREQVADWLESQGY